jgi:hypothetical protein
VDPVHHRLAKIGLTAAQRYGFALAGGYAVQAHGILERPSEDIDLFTPGTDVTNLPSLSMPSSPPIVTPGSGSRSPNNSRRSPG